MSKIVDSYDVVVWADSKLGAEDYEKRNKIKEWLFEDGVINYQGNREDYFPSEHLDLHLDKFLSENEIEGLIQKHTDYKDIDSAKEDYGSLGDVFFDNDNLLEDYLKTIDLKKLFSDTLSRFNAGELLLNTYLMKKGLFHKSVLIVDK